MTMSRQDFLLVSGLESDTLDIWLEQRWIIPQEPDVGGAGAEAAFHDRDLARARLIQDLRGDLGVNDPGVDVILHLVDQLHGLRGALRELHGAMREPPERS